MKKIKIFIVCLLLPFFILSSCNAFNQVNSNIDIKFNIKIPNFENTSKNVIKSSAYNEDYFILDVLLKSQNGKVNKSFTQNVYSGQMVEVVFDSVLVGEVVQVEVSIKNKDSSIISSGYSNWTKIVSGTNIIEVVIDIDASVENIEISSQPEGKIEIATSDSLESIEHTLSVTASLENGVLSFEWEELDSNGEYVSCSEEYTSSSGYSCSITVTLNKGESKTYRCKITNTLDSESVGVYSDPVTVAYVEGELTSISASYEENGYQLLSEDFNYSNVKVKETYTKDENSVEIEVSADSSRYQIENVNNDALVIGYVPFTISNMNNSSLTSQLRVPVKYTLPQEGLKITGTANTDEWGTVGNPELVAQFTGSATLSVRYAGGGGSSVPYYIYENENSERASDYDIMSSGVDIAWDNGTVTENPAYVSVDNTTSGTKTYTATLTPKTDQTWCIGESVSASYYVKVCPWEIKVLDSDDNTEISDLDNLVEALYIINIRNDAINETFDFSSISYVSTDAKFEITEIDGVMCLGIPTASTESDQTATISAKVEDQVIASVTVTVKQETAQTAYLDSDGITINSSTIEYTALVPVLDESTTVTKTETSGAFTSGNVILEPYAIGKYEVTQALYKAVMDSNPSSSKIGDNFPVEKVSWYDAVKFCNELTRQTMGEDDCVYTISEEQKDEDGIVTSATVTVDSTKKGYRLPTEAEWEFAARGGVPSDTTNWNYTYAGSDTVDDVAWYFNSYGDGEGYTIEVYDESLNANSLELKNMCGNVAEWTNTEIDDEGTTKIIVRGGHYESYANKCTVCNRENNVTKNYTDKKIGLRLCRTITE